MSSAEADKWLVRQNLDAHIVLSNNYLDYEEFDEPLKRSAQTFLLGRLNKFSRTATIPLKLHEVTMDDELINPLEGEDSNYYQQYYYISPENQSAFAVDVFPLRDDKSGPFKLQVSVLLSGAYAIESRTRYNVWDLLGDVGGFH